MSHEAQPGLFRTTDGAELPPIVKESSEVNGLYLYRGQNCLRTHKFSPIDCEEEEDENIAWNAKLADFDTTPTPHKVKAQTTADDIAMSPSSSMQKQEKTGPDQSPMGDKDKRFQSIAPWSQHPKPVYSQNQIGTPQLKTPEPVSTPLPAPPQIND